MEIRGANLSDKEVVLKLLDDFRADCMEQITGQSSESETARTEGKNIYEKLLSRKDYCIRLLVNHDSIVVGIITGYLCPMLRSGKNRAEVEEFFILKENRGRGNAEMLMNSFFDWCKENNVSKVNLESENGLERAHAFYKKYGFQTSAQRFVKKLS